MRISDWSSDVCSSDLHPARRILSPFFKSLHDLVHRRFVRRGHALDMNGSQSIDRIPLFREFGQYSARILASQKRSSLAAGDAVDKHVDFSIQPDSDGRSEEQTYEFLHHMRISYGV